MQVLEHQVDIDISQGFWLSKLHFNKILFSMLIIFSLSIGPPAYVYVHDFRHDIKIFLGLVSL